MLSKISKNLINKVRANQVCFPTYTLELFSPNLSAVRPRRRLKKFRQF